MDRKMSVCFLTTWHHSGVIVTGIDDLSLWQNRSNDIIIIIIIVYCSMFPSCHKTLLIIIMSYSADSIIFSIIIIIIDFKYLVFTCRQTCFERTLIQTTSTPNLSFVKHLNNKFCTCGSKACPAEETHRQHESNTRLQPALKQTQGCHCNTAGLGNPQHKPASLTFNNTITCCGMKVH